MGWTRAIASPVGAGVVFVLALSGGALVHLDLPAVRRAAASRVNAALASALPGKVTIERIGSIALTHVEGIDARAEDPDGVTVLHVRGAGARIALGSLVRSLLGAGDIRVEIGPLAVEGAEINLDADASGTLRLVRTFVAPGPSAGSSRGVALSLRDVRLEHATVHGRPAGAPAIDADIAALQASLAVAPGALTIDVARASVVARRALGDAEAAGDIEAHLVRPSQGGGDLAARLAFTGKIGSLVASASAAYDGARIDAIVDVPHATPEELRTAWPSCPFAAPAAAHAEAHGALASLAVDARANVGAGTIVISGPVTVGDAVHADLHVGATRVDVHALSTSAPSSELGASGDVGVDVRPDGALASKFRLQFDGGRMGNARIPAASLSGDLSRDAKATVSGRVDASVREPGAPAQISVRLAPKGSALDVRFDASVEAPKLEDVARLGGVVRGSGKVSAHGTVDLAAGRVDAQLDASADSLSSGALQVQTAALQARLSGPLAAPRVDAQLHGEGLHAPGLDFATMQAEAHGSPASAPVSVVLTGRDAEVTASADVGLTNGASLRNVQVAVRRGGVHARAQAALVRVAGHEVRVDDAVIEGFGQPLRASVRASPFELEVHAEGRHVNLGHVARFAGAAGSVRGRLSLSADATVRASGASGHIVVDIAEGGLGEWGDAEAHLDATLDHRRASGRFEARLGDIGHLEAQSSSLEVGGTGRLTPASWRSAWGAVDVQAHVDLAKLAARLPLERLGMRTLSGSLDVSSRVARDSAGDVTPDVDVVAKTTGLAATGAGAASWHVEGTEVAAHVRVDGRTGFTAADAQLTDARGVLLTFGATSDSIPYAPLFLTDQPLMDLVRTTRVAANLGLPARDLADLPPLLGTRGMHGEVAASATFQGSLANPTIDVRGTLRRGRTDVSLLALPLDLDVSGHYDGAHAEATFDAGGRGEPVLAVQMAVDARATDVLDGLRSGVIPWRASGHAKLTKFPLQSLAYLDDRQVRGHVSGELSLDGLHDDAHASLSLASEDVRVGDVSCRSARVQATIGGGELDATARIDEAPGPSTLPAGAASPQRAEDGGFAEATAHVGAPWGARMAPSIDTSHPIDVAISAKQFRAGLLLPLASRVFSELDGRLDANAKVHVDPAAKTVRPEGTIELHDGLFELNSVGGEFHDANARIVLTQDGVIRLEDASARGLSGKIQAAATARVAGGAFAGARGVLQVPKQDPLPLIVEGVQVGQFDGQLTIAVDPDPSKSGLAVDVDVPSAHVELPLAAAHAVESLGDIPGVRIGIQRPGSDFVPIELDGDDPASRSTGSTGTPMRVAVRLGKDVQVRRGTDLDVRLGGAMAVTADQDVRASGQIHLTHGTIDVQGKPFAIEDGSVTFVGDPSNPQVKLRASWTAPDGTTVFADFVGPLKTGKVTLSSDPVLTKTEILSLILFGTADQGSGAPGSSQSSQSGSALGGAAGAAAGGAATAPVNRALGGVNQWLDNVGLAGGISTKIDTSQATPRPEVELQIARDVSVQLAWVLGNPPLGSNLDTTLFTLSWRFLRQWSMQATVGDAGTSILDFVWKHRY
jgi:translocation and assembly module TamB